LSDVFWDRAIRPQSQEQIRRMMARQPDRVNRDGFGGSICPDRIVPAKLTENVEIELAVYYGNSSFDDMNWDLELKATNSAK
jgi:hypothetical protein